jgi:hypothetical protein
VRRLSRAGPSWSPHRRFGERGSLLREAAHASRRLLMDWSLFTWALGGSASSSPFRMRSTSRSRPQRASSSRAIPYLTQPWISFGRALGADSRWALSAAPRSGRILTAEHQHPLVWVLGSATTREEARQIVRGGVYDIVTDVIPGASFCRLPTRPSKRASPRINSPREDGPNWRSTGVGLSFV